MAILVTKTLSDYLQEPAYAPIKTWIEYDLRRSIKQITYLSFKVDTIDIPTNDGYKHKRPGPITVIATFDDSVFREDLDELKARYNTILFKREMRKRLKTKEINQQ